MITLQDLLPVALGSINCINLDSLLSRKNNYSKAKCFSIVGFNEFLLAGACGLSTCYQYPQEPPFFPSLCAKADKSDG